MKETCNKCRMHSCGDGCKTKSDPRDPIQDWIETEIGKRFPEEVYDNVQGPLYKEMPLTIPLGQLRVRIFHLCMDVLDRERSKMLPLQGVVSERVSMTQGILPAKWHKPSKENE
jgi:hypothetical protein